MIMAHRTVMAAAVTVVLGVVTQIVTSEAQQEIMRTVLFGYTAQRQTSGAWNFQVRTAGNAYWKDQPGVDLNVQVTEADHPNDVKNGNWVEMIAGARVSRSGVATTQQLQNSQNFSEVLQQKHSASNISPRKKAVPSGYNQIVGFGHYKVHRDKAQWETARRRCAKEGGHLLIINSAMEAAAVVAASGLSGWNWLGFDDLTADEEYITLHGTTLEEAGYVRWASDEPTDDLHCGVADENGLLGTGTCDLKREFICEFHGPDEYNLEERDPLAPLGYQAVGNLGYYRTHHNRVRWETARRRCQDEGAHLLIVNSQAEADAVLKGSGLPDWFWLGFDDYDFGGEYVYLDGTRLVDSGYVKWANHEPTEDLHCGVARKDGLLGTGNCDRKRHYICEWIKPRNNVTRDRIP